MASAAKYLSNVAKSVKYASIDVLKSYNPVITDMKLMKMYLKLFILV